MTLVGISEFCSAPSSSDLLPPGVLVRWRSQLVICLLTHESSMVNQSTVANKKDGLVCSIKLAYIASHRASLVSPLDIFLHQQRPLLTHVLILPKLAHRSCRPLPNIPLQHLLPHFRPHHVHHLPQIMAQVPYHERVMLAHRPLRRRRRGVQE